MQQLEGDRLKPRLHLNEAVQTEQMPHLCAMESRFLVRRSSEWGSVPPTFEWVFNLKVRPHLHGNTNKAGWGEAYTNICLDCNTRQNVVIHRASEWFSLKYRLQADSVRSASDWTEAVFLSSVTRLHCYACLASACLVRVFVLMWTQLYILKWGKLIKIWHLHQNEWWTHSLWSTNSRRIVFVLCRPISASGQMQHAAFLWHVHICMHTGARLPPFTTSFKCGCGLVVHFLTSDLFLWIV